MIYLIEKKKIFIYKNIFFNKKKNKLIKLTIFFFFLNRKTIISIMNFNNKKLKYSEHLILKNILFIFRE